MLTQKLVKPKLVLDFVLNFTCFTGTKVQTLTQTLVQPKLVLDFVKKMLEVANPAVKKAGVEVLVTLRRCH
jgi:hypothetical protein